MLAWQTLPQPHNGVHHDLYFFGKACVLSGLYGPPYRLAFSSKTCKQPGARPLAMASRCSSRGPANSCIAQGLTPKMVGKEWKRINRGHNLHRCLWPGGRFKKNSFRVATALHWPPPTLCGACDLCQSINAYLQMIWIRHTYVYFQNHGPRTVDMSLRDLIHVSLDKLWQVTWPASPLHIEAYTLWRSRWLAIAVEIHVRLDGTGTADNIHLIFYILLRYHSHCLSGKMQRGSLAVQQANSNESGVIVGHCWKNHKNRWASHHGSQKSSFTCSQWQWTVGSTSLAFAPAANVMPTCMNSLISGLILHSIEYAAPLSMAVLGTLNITLVASCCHLKLGRLHGFIKLVKKAWRTDWQTLAKRGFYQPFSTSSHQRSWHASGEMLKLKHYPQRLR